MKALIIEDEAPLAKGLEAMLRKLRPEIELIGPARDTLSAKAAISENKDLDVIFADIRLEDGFSFDVFDSLETDAMIVFTTAYDEYALKAFDYNCIDYLLKPYDLRDLQDALERLERRQIPSGHAPAREASAAMFDNSPKYRRKLELDRVDGKIIMDIDEICYLEYDMRLVRVFGRNRTSGTSPLSLSKLAEELDPSRFMKVSRTHIVRLEEIEMIRPTLRRSKMLVLKEPYSHVEIKVTSEMIREVRSALRQK